MNRLNWILTLSSLSVLLVTIERFSFTTKILLQPYSFLRLHELVQMAVVILFTVIIPFFVFREVSDNFSLLKTKKGLLLGLLFITGIYFYATGNGVHEIASFYFNQHCDTKNFRDVLCGSLFFNDYYTGNILYFIGAIFMNVSPLLLEKMRPNKTYQKKDLLATMINAVIFSFAIFAYAAFDRVLVGLAFSLMMTIITLWLFLPVRKKYLQYPYNFYATLTYLLGTVTAFLFRIIPFPS